MEYKAGVTKSVNPVANVNPKIIVTAIPPKATSNNNGTIPKIVVVAAINTGRVRETVASTMDVYKSTQLYTLMYQKSKFSNS